MNQILKSFWADDRGILPMLPLLGLLGLGVGGGAYFKRAMEAKFANDAQDEQGSRFGDALSASGINVRAGGDQGQPQIGGGGQPGGQPGQQQIAGPGGQQIAQQLAQATGQTAQRGPVNYGLLGQELGKQGMIQQAMGLLNNDQNAQNQAVRDESQFGYSTKLAEQGFGYEQQTIAQRGAVSSQLQKENAALQIGVNRAKAAQALADAGENPFQFGIKFTRKEAADVIGQQTSLSNAHSNLGRLAEIAGEFGLGGSLSPEVAGEVGALIDTSILPALAQLTNSGVLQEAEAERLRNAIGDPTSLTSIDSNTLASLKTVQHQIEDKMHSNRMAYQDIFGTSDGEGSRVGIRDATQPQQQALERQGLQPVQ